MVRRTATARVYFVRTSTRGSTKSTSELPKGRLTIHLANVPFGASPESAAIDEKWSLSEVLQANRHGLAGTNVKVSKSVRK